MIDACLNRLRLPRGRFGWLVLAAGLTFAGCSGDDTGSGDDDASEETPSGDDDASSATTPSTAPDGDGDGVADTTDNCPDDKNADQADTDKDGDGDACDNCPADTNDDQADSDNDGAGDVCDNCADDKNSDQSDSDADGVGDVCDNCADDTNPDQIDTDADGDGDECDACEEDSENDADGDGKCEVEDNCDTTANGDQADGDADGVGDACDACPQDPAAETDGDNICPSADNCDDNANPGQEDMDGDGEGDACDLCNDPDHDDICKQVDNCPDAQNTDQTDSDGDGQGDACDACSNDAGNDSDGDGNCADVDNCPLVANGNQMDRDGDKVGDACDPCPDEPNDDGSDGCGDDADHTPSPEGTFFIYGTNPDNGYKAVPTAPSGRIYLSEPYTGDVAKIHVTLTSQFGQQIPQSINISSDKTEVRFYPQLLPNTDYCLTAEIEHQDSVKGRWPLRHVACFTTTRPCGTPINVGYDSQILKLGGTGPFGLKAFNDAMDDAAENETGDDYPVVLLLEDIAPSDDFPLTFDADLGAYDIDAETAVNTLKLEGYTSSFVGCSIDASSNFTCAGESAIFPVYVGGYGVNIYVSEAKMTAKAQASGNISYLTNFLLDGYITEDNLYRIFFELGEEYEPLAQYIELDLDLNSDGTEDAATFQVSTVPKPLTLENSFCPEF